VLPNFGGNFEGSGLRDEYPRFNRILPGVGAQWELPGAVGVQWELPGPMAPRNQGDTNFWAAV
jgi:hypothetical protein